MARLVSQPTWAPTNKVTAMVIAAALVGALDGAIVGACGVVDFGWCGQAIAFAESGSEVLKDALEVAFIAAVGWWTKERA